MDAAGTVVQELPAGMTARQPGCHVRLILKDPQKIGVWLLILEQRERGWGYKRIAQHLNALGIPSPGAGSLRTDHGVKHAVTGRWCANTIKELCNNKAILGVQDYGRRSEGTYRRLGDAGPRPLTDADRDADERPKVVMNDPSLRIARPLGIEPLWEEARWRRGQELAESRGASQRGVPRRRSGAVSARDAPGRPDRRLRLDPLRHDQRRAGPLQVRAIHADRGRRVPEQRRRRRSDAPLDAQELGPSNRPERQPGPSARLIEERARRERVEPASGPIDREAALVATLARREADLEVIGRRMATEADDGRYEAIAHEYDRVRDEVGATKDALAAVRSSMAAAPTTTIEEEVESAMTLLDDVARIAGDEAARADINRVLGMLGLRIGLTFGDAVKGKKRRVRRLLGGVMAFGDSPLPVPMHGAANAAQIVYTPDRAVPGVAEGQDGDMAAWDRAMMAAHRVATSEGWGPVQAGPAGDRVPLGAATRPVDRRLEETSITKESRGERI